MKIYKLELSDEVVAVTPYGATIIANYTYPGEIPQIKVCVSTNSEVTNATETDAVLDKTTMTATIEGLSSDTKYYYRFKYSNGISLIYTDTKDFTTEHAVVVPSVVTIPITTITANSAVSGGAISDNGGDEIIEKGICWSTTEQPTIDDAHTSDGSGNGAFVSNMTELSPNTVYYVRAYATNSDGVGYGNELSFTTTASLASLTTKTVTNITPTSASCGGNITNSGGMDITARGVCWSTSHNPSLDDQHSEDGTGIGDFNSNLTGLIANVKYYVRAYATSSYGTSYGNEVEFTTQMGAPTVTTKSVTGITGSSASCGGNVTNSGGGTITARGVCWSTSQNPTIADNHTTDGTGTGEFTSSITGLDNNVTYYVRAYAANSNGTSYGEERDFTTQEGLAIVTTNNVTSITATSAICGGEVTDDGGFSITARGVCWSTSQNPTVTDSHTTDGTGTGTFTSSMTSLTYNTTYYVRAYATNNKGTSYGEETTFITSKLAPTVTTADVTAVTSNSATSGGNVTSDGGASVTARGVCWSTSQNPTISGNHTTDGNGTGEFTSNLADLTENTTYYVRAYATNSVGTNYGEQKTFTTTQSTSLPSVATYQVSDVTATTASCGGFVVSDGGSTVTDRGVCWSTSPNPVLNINYMTHDGSGTGEFSSSITGLSPNTTYYVRAYASNSIGTNYGEEKSFTTSDAKPVVTTTAVSEIAQTTAISGGNVTSEGGYPVTSRGVCWSTSPNPILNVNYMTNDGSGAGEFTSNITGLSLNTTYYVRAYASNSAGTSYGNEVSFVTASGSLAPTGAINGLFSISATQQVYFSQGNLQYKASTNTWRFADNQYDIVGNGNVNISSIYTGWIDLFGWGTSGYNHGAICYQPWSISANGSDYWVYGLNIYNIYDQTCKADWGYNAISNGGNTENLWRVPTQDEWSYLFMYRNTSSNVRFAKAQVNEVDGVIVLPDDWNTNYYSINNPNDWQGASYTDNIIDLNTWISSFEANGVVFLPAARYREGNTYYYWGSSDGHYWSSTYSQYSENATPYLHFTSADLWTSNTYANNRHHGRSVRLIYSPNIQTNNIAVTTNQAANITQTSALCGGDVTTDGTNTVSAKGVCWSTSSEPTINDSHTTNGSGTSPFTANITGLSSNTTYYVRAYATNEVGTYYGNEATFTTLSNSSSIPTGAINGLYSINSSGDKVYFSKGNLQYIGSAATPYWKFADNQWDYLGDNGQGSTNMNVDRDLFGWGTSGWNCGNTYYQPWDTDDSDGSLYGPPGENNLTDEYVNSDWGYYNAINNGGNTTHTWRTLSQMEWNYVMHNRNSSSGILFVKAIINGINGLIILPDDWNSSYYSLYSINNGNAAYSANMISSTSWANNLETHGAVFLPAAGTRTNTNVTVLNQYGVYWMSNCAADYGATGFSLSPDYVTMRDMYNRYYGFSVRLVHDAN